MTPTARSLDLLREMGYTAEVVERWVPGAKIRRDLFGFADVLGCHAKFGVLAIQCTTGDHAAARTSKAMDEARLLTWLKAGAKFEVWGWALRGARGKRKLWVLSRRIAHLDSGAVKFSPVGVTAEIPDSCERHAFAGAS